MFKSKIKKLFVLVLGTAMITGTFGATSVNAASQEQYPNQVQQTVTNNQEPIPEREHVKDTSDKQLQKSLNNNLQSNVVPEFNFQTKTVKLNNGVEMPIHGLGTYHLTPAEAEESTYIAIKNGYRLIDTANAYMNEKAIGRGIVRAGVPREQLFITTKLWPSEYENVEKAIDDTLARLHVKYIDLVLLHQPFGNYIEGYKGLEKAMAEGKVRAIGLSNFYEDKFDEIIHIATVPPAVLQVEMNPYVQQTEMREHIKPYGTVLNAWFPLGGRTSTSNNTQTHLFNDPVIAALSKKYGKSPAQIILRWELQTGIIAIPGASNPAYILENDDIFDFELTADEMDKIKALDRKTLRWDFRHMGNKMPFGSFSVNFNAQE